MASILLFCMRKKTYRNKLTDCVMANNEASLFLKDHRCLEPYFYQFFLVFWTLYLIQFLKIVTFPSNCTVCNSYLQIVLQNHSEVFGSFNTQGFPLMRNNIFKEISAIDGKSNNKPLLFFKHIFKGEFFLLGRPNDFKVCKISFTLAIFSYSFSSRYCFFFYLIVWTPFLTSF